MPAVSASIALNQFSTFGDLLKFLRRRAGLTQRELSIAVGYSDTHVSRLEQNQRLPDIPTITARFVPALDVEKEPEIVTRLLELAAAVRREDAPAPGLPPFRGLLYFDEADADLFFGREDLTAKLVVRLTPSPAGASTASESRFLAIVGASGSGKSSVARAGLVPAFRWNPDSAGWPVHIITPTAHPLEALAATLSPASKSATAKASLADELARDSRALHEYAARAVRQVNASRLLLVVDQFEELFALCRNDAEQKAFVGNLLTAAFEPRGPAIVVIALRADFYAHCARFPKLREALALSQEYIGAMNTDELRRAIEEPARRGHWELEGGLVDVLLKDVEGEPGALPLLSHALLETWQRRRGHVLTLSGYAASGGVRGAIAESAEAVFHDQLNPPQRAIARQIFLRLTELGEDETLPDTRRRVALDELVSKPEDAPAVREVLTLLADARLITTELETAEVAHEALIREWPTLRGWLTENREGLRLHRHLTDASQEWAQMGRDDDAAYRGARLAQALEWAAANTGELNALEREFLETSKGLAEREESEREAQRRRELESARKLAEAEKRRAEEQSHSATQLRRRAMYLAGAFVLALSMAIAALFFGEQARQSAVSAQNEQRIAFSRELAAAAISSLEVDPERSILLALEAVSAAQSAGLPVPLEAEDALHQAVQASRSELVLRGHEDAVWDVAFSPDGAHIATTSRDRSVRIWAAATGQETLVLRGHTGMILSVAYSPDGKRLATAGDDRTVIVWDAATGEQLMTLSGHTGSVSRATFSGDGRRLVTASGDRTAKVWDANTGQELLTLTGHAGGLLDAAFSPDDSRLATASADRTVRVWDAATGEELLVLRGHTAEVKGVAFSPDGTRLATASWDRTARVWDAATGRELLTLFGHGDWVFDVAFSPDGTRLATVGKDGRVKVWDAATGRELLSLSGHTDRIFNIDFSSDGNRLATASADGTARVWNVSLARELLAWPVSGGGGDVAISPDGKLLAAGNGDEGTAEVWDAATGAELLTLVGHTDNVTAITFSPDGTRLATASADATAKIWDTPTGRLLFTLSSHDNAVNDVAFSPDGFRLATASNDWSVRIWDAATGQILNTLTGGSEARAVAFSPDGARLAAAYEGGLAAVWDTAALTEREPLLLHGHRNGVLDVAFSPECLNASEAPAEQCEWHLATVSMDRTAKVWDASGRELFTLSGHTSGVTSAAFSPDGSRLATASLDGTVKVWDTATGRELMRLLGSIGNVHSVAFTPLDGGAHLVIGGGDGLSMYLLRLEDLVALARSRLTRSLTPDECRRYLHGDEAACASLAGADIASLQPSTSEGRVCHVAEVGGQDSIFNQLQYNGARSVAERFGWEVIFLEAVDPADYDRLLATFLASNCDLIMTGLFSMSDSTKAAAEANPDQNYYTSDVAYDPPLDSVWTSVYATDQAAFLAGYVAASVSKTGRIGAFGGIDIPPVTDFMDGFALGAAYYNTKHGTNIEVLGWDAQTREGSFTGNFINEGDGRLLAEQLMNDGADVIMPVAGPMVGWGAATAVQEREGVYYVGVDVDWTLLAPEFADFVLTSVEKRYDASAAEAVQAVVDGTFTGGIHVGALENGGVGISPFHNLDSLVSPQVKAELEQITADIIAGKIKTKP